MGLFDIFSNSDASNAAAAQTAGLNAAYQQLVPWLSAGTAVLGQNYGQGQGALTSNAGNATGALNQNYAGAINTLQNQQQTNNAGQNQLANLLGLNGANGSATAQNTLQNLPGYQFALNQGTQNVLRNQSATGQLNSGNTNMDLTNYAQGLASQNYNNYVSQLQPFLSASNTGAANIAGAQTGLGQNLASNYNTLGSNLNQNWQNLGNAVNANENTGGAAAYGTQAGIGNAQAQADYANLASSGALWGGILNAAGNVAGKAMAGSDRRIKKNIKRVGTRNGLPWYEFQYINGKGKKYYGFMADEVEKVKPDAVKRSARGFKVVDYAKALQAA